MTQEFIPYEQALALKELGFDESCFGSYVKLTETQNTFFMNDVVSEIDRETPLHKSLITKAPLYQQAFRWFRENYSTHVEIHENTDWEEDNESWSFVIFKYKLGDNDEMKRSITDYNTYEEAELACLIKLIEITKTN